METITITASKEDSCERLDKFLSLMDLDISRNSAQIMIDEGLVLVNGCFKNKKYLICCGDIVTVQRKEPVKLDNLPENIPLEIVYEDEYLLVVNKPRGMVVHPAPGNENGTLVNALLYHCSGKLSSINGIIRPGIVHRIDKNTSGLLVVAKDDKTHLGLSQLFAAHDIDRVYYAIVHGTPKNLIGTIDKPIGRSPNDRKKMCVTQKNSRNAITHYEVLESFKNFSFIKLQLETGRTHQIRVHMASIGHPVAGDNIYGPAKGLELNGQCLHAAVLGFVHPIKNEKLYFESELPQYFNELLSKLRETAL